MSLVCAYTCYVCFLTRASFALQTTLANSPREDKRTSRGSFESRLSPVLEQPQEDNASSEKELQLKPPGESQVGTQTLVPRRAPRDASLPGESQDATRPRRDRTAHDAHLPDESQVETQALPLPTHPPRRDDSGLAAQGESQVGTQPPPVTRDASLPMESQVGTQAFIQQSCSGRESMESTLPLLTQVPLSPEDSMVVDEDRIPVGPSEALTDNAGPLLTQAEEDLTGESVVSTQPLVQVAEKADEARLDNPAPTTQVPTSEANEKPNSLPVRPSSRSPNHSNVPHTDPEAESTRTVLNRDSLTAAPSPAPAASLHKPATNADGASVENTANLSPKSKDSSRALLPAEEGAKAGSSRHAPDNPPSPSQESLRTPPRADRTQSSLTPDCGDEEEKGCLPTSLVTSSLPAQSPALLSPKRMTPANPTDADVSGNRGINAARGTLFNDSGGASRTTKHSGELALPAELPSTESGPADAENRGESAKAADEDDSTVDPGNDPEDECLIAAPPSKEDTIPVGSTISVPPAACGKGDDEETEDPGELLDQAVVGIDGCAMGDDGVTNSTEKAMEASADESHNSQQQSVSAPQNESSWLHAETQAVPESVSQKVQEGNEETRDGVSSAPAVSPRPSPKQEVKAKQPILDSNPSSMQQSKMDELPAPSGDTRYVEDPKETHTTETKKRSSVPPSHRSTKKRAKVAEQRRTPDQKAQAEFQTEGESNNQVVILDEEETGDCISGSNVTPRPLFPDKSDKAAQEPDTSITLRTSTTNVSAKSDRAEPLDGPKETPASMARKRPVSTSRRSARKKTKMAEQLQTPDRKPTQRGTRSQTKPRGGVSILETSGTVRIMVTGCNADEKEIKRVSDFVPPTPSDDRPLT